MLLCVISYILTNIYFTIHSQIYIKNPMCKIKLMGFLQFQ